MIDNQISDGIDLLPIWFFALPDVLWITGFFVLFFALVLIILYLKLVVIPVCYRN